MEKKDGDDSVENDVDDVEPCWSQFSSPCIVPSVNRKQRNEGFS